MNDAGNFFESLIDGTSFAKDLTRRRKKKGRVFCARWGSGRRNSDHQASSLLAGV
jgi:hypothetical protein